MFNFENIVNGLDSEIFTSMDAIQSSIDKAKMIADRYESVSLVKRYCIYHFVDNGNGKRMCWPG